MTTVTDLTREPSPTTSSTYVEALAHSCELVLERVPVADRPVVVFDAMVIISDCVRISRGGESISGFLTSRRFIHPITAVHIDEKVYARIPKVCGSKSDPASAIDVYETVYRPFIRFVDPGNLMLNTDRVRQVAAQDPEDIPVAQLAELLAPVQVLSKDKHLRRAGIGSFQFADALIAAEQKMEFDSALTGSAESAALMLYLACSGVAGYGRLLRRSAPALLLSIAGVLLAAAYLRKNVRTSLTALRQTSARFGDLLEEVGGRQAAVRNGYESTLLPGSAVTSLESLIARVLAASHTPKSAETIRTSLPHEQRQTVTRDRVLAALRREPAFQLSPGRGWTLGMTATGLGGTRDQDARLS